MSNFFASPRCLIRGLWYRFRYVISVTVSATSVSAIRYTNAVSPYITCMSSCLKDSSLAVRTSAFTNITRLLQEDFLKLKGALFYKLLSCVADDESSFADLGKLSGLNPSAVVLPSADRPMIIVAKQTFIYEVSRRHKAIYSQHFVECFFFYNNYTKHSSEYLSAIFCISVVCSTMMSILVITPEYNRFMEKDDERSMFTLSGKAKSRYEITGRKFAFFSLDDERFSFMTVFQEAH